MVSDSKLVEQLREFLRTSDLTTTTNAIVRRKLEEHFGADLSEKKAFIREQVDLFLQSQLDNDKEEGKEGEEDEGDDVAKDEVEGSDGGDGAGESGQEGDEDEEEEGEEEEGTSNGKRKNRSIKSNKLNKDVKKRKGGGFTKVCSLSPQLQNFLGVPELARTEVVKQLWVYIRGNNLQDPGNKRKIICDEKLNELFNVKTIDMFQMNKVLAKHIWPLASEDGPSKPAEKETKPRKEREEGSDELPRKEKRRKGGDDKRETKGGSKGFLAPLQLSDALVKFLGTGESALSRSDVVKRMWEYIKQNNLQNPADKRQIICDEKLNELFGVDSFTGFTVPKLLATHFTKIEQ